MNPHQTNEHIPFEYQNCENINTNIDVNALNGSVQNNFDLKNEIKIKPTKNLFLKISNYSTENQLDQNTSYFEINQNLAQNPSSFSFFIVNQFDAHKLVQQPLVNSPNSILSNSLSPNHLSPDNLKSPFTDKGQIINGQISFSNRQIFKSDSNLMIKKDSIEQTNPTVCLNQIVNEKSEQLNGKTDNEIQSLNFLELQCPNNGSYNSNHPVSCY